MTFQSIYESPVSTGEDFTRRRVLANHWRSRALGLIAAACPPSGMEGRAGADPIAQLAMQRSGKGNVLNKDQMRAAAWIRALASAAMHPGAPSANITRAKVDTSMRADRDWLIIGSMDAHAEACVRLGEIAEMVGEEAFVILIRVVVHFQTIASAALLLEEDEKATARRVARDATKKLCGRTLRAALRRIAAKMPDDMEVNDDHK